MKYKKMMLYKEKSYQNRDETKSSIENNMNILTDEQVNKVTQYLESGYLLLNFVSPTTDPYDQKTIIPWVIYTDGMYVWDSIIIHWVERYKIRLPKDFLNHVHLAGGALDNTDSLRKIGGVNEVMKKSDPLWI